MNAFNRIDVILFQSLNYFAGRSSFLDALIIFCTTYLIFILYAVPVALWLSAYFRRLEIQRREYKKLLFSAFTAAVIARYIIAEAIRILIARARPFEVLAGVQQLIEHSAGKSFPSGHATLAFAIGTAIFLRYPKLGIPCLILATLVSVSRVAAGIHWPSDVAAGALIGMMTAMIVIQRRVTGR